VNSPINLTINVTNGTVGKALPFTVKFKNTYSGPVTLTSLRITSPDTLSADEGRYARKEANLLDARGATLEKNDVLALEGTVTPMREGERTLTVNAAYTAGTTRLVTEQASVHAQAQGLLLTAFPGLRELTLDLTNEATEQLSGITINWGDGATEAVTLLRPDQRLTLTHRYEQSATTPTTITGTYTLRGTTEERTVQVTIPGLSPAPAQAVQPGEQTPVDSQPQEPESEESQTKPTPTTKPASAPAEAKPGMLKRALLWFEGLFK
jgi:hypothetical protein